MARPITVIVAVVSPMCIVLGSGASFVVLVVCIQLTHGGLRATLYVASSGAVLHLFKGAHAYALSEV